MKSLPLTTRLYLYVTLLAGIAVFCSQAGLIKWDQPWLLLVLCTLASVAMVLKVEGSSERTHYTFSFVVYGFTFAVLGPVEAILVIVASQCVDWIWNRPPVHLQLFQTAAFVLSMQTAGLVHLWIGQGNSPDTWQSTLALLLAMAIFNVLNRLMAGSLGWLAYRENFRSSGIFDFFPLMLDQSLLYFGASLSIVWYSNPFAIVLFVVPAYLLHSALRVPALERKSEIDSKTGLFNHSYFKRQLDNELARANRFDRSLSVILADLDLLRNINNTYGHLAGDEVLIGVARTMKQAVRDYDVVCRFGGEEFAILLTETTLLQAYERAENIRRSIENMEFTVPTSQTPIRATMSFGVAHREDSSQTPDEIVHKADLAVYHSKLSGRNRTFAFTSSGYIDLPADRKENWSRSNYADFYATNITLFGEYWVGYPSEDPLGDL